MLCKTKNSILKISFYLVFTLSSIYGYAANKSIIDSLETHSKLVDEIERIEIYNQLSELYVAESDAKSYYYADSAYKIALINNSINGIIASLNNLGIVSKNQGNFTLAFNYSMRALQYCQLVHSKYESAKALANIVDIYFNQKNNNEALIKYNEAYKIYQTLNYKEGIIDMLLGIGEIHILRMNKSKSLESFSKALNLSRQIGDSIKIAQSYVHLGIWYRYDFKFFIAIDYFKKAETIFNQLNDIRGLISTYENIGITYSLNGNYSKSIDYHNKSYTLATTIGDKINLLSSYNNLFNAYYGLSDFKEALKYHILYNNLKDSITAETSKQIFQMQFDYEKENSEKEIKVLTNQNVIIDLRLKQNLTLIKAFLISFFIILTLLLISIYAYNQKRKSIKELNTQKDLIFWEKMQSETLLLNILPFDIAEELKNKGKATVRHYNMVSVMFADFKGFSQITEMIAPEILIAELDKYFIKFDEIISKYNLEKIKTIGDCYMCVGGIPNPNTTNPTEAVLAALEFQQFVNECNIIKEEKKEILWELRIGIHTGKVIAGVVGKKKFAYDIWGDTVNTASRMESGSEVGMVNVSGATYEAIKEYFDCTYRGKMAVKNIKEMDMYYVNFIKPQYSQSRKGISPNGKLIKIIKPTAKIEGDIV